MSHRRTLKSDTAPPGGDSLAANEPAQPRRKPSRSFDEGAWGEPVGGDEGTR
jgi:hypothetical protein